MAFPNGRIPASALMPIPGNGQLVRAPAIAYTAMHQRASKDGVSLAIFENSIRRTYRPFDAQVAARRMWCAQGKCSNAAFPGTSNHGEGTTVDLMSLLQRRWIDRHGAVYGWAKRWSDAAHEWWHLRWRAGVFTPPPPGPRVIRKGVRDGDDIQTLQVYLRALGFLRKSWKVHRSYTLTVRQAVRAFQRKNGMTVDGEVGPQTLAALKRAARKR